MTNYQELKKLDEKTLQKLQEGTGPSDKCICNLFSSPEKKGLGTTLRKAFGISKKSAPKGAPQKTAPVNAPRRNLLIPLSKGHKSSVAAQMTSKPGFKPEMQSTKEVVKRGTSCGKCGCDDNQVVLKHSFANIRITSPDVTSVCPCPTNCYPDRDKFKNDIKVTIEHAQIKHQPMFNTQSAHYPARSESRSEIDIELNE